MPKASRKELRKSLFKKGASAREKAQNEAKVKHETIEASKPPVPPPAKRYILFVGNLPYDIKEEEISTHFRNSKPSSIRLRSNGICFLEFSGDDAAARLHHALQFHHSLLKGRKINVEFSAGGGGNSSRRREKIKQKNQNFQEELKAKGKQSQAINTAAGSKSSNPAKAGQSKPEVSAEDAQNKGINPARLAALRSRN